MEQQSAYARADERIASADGTLLRIRSWRPRFSPRGVLVIVHGFNSHSRYFEHVAQYLVAEGVAVYALDLRGRGESEGERYYIETFEDYLADVHALVSAARRREGAVPLFLLGHSAGGVISCLYALDHQTELAGLVCESFAFQVFAPAFAITVAKGLSHLLPHTRALRLNIDDFSRDPEVLRAMHADPFVRDEMQPLQTVAEMARADDRLGASFAHLRVPLLILHGTADKVTRATGSEQFYREAGSPDKTLQLYEGHAHDLLNDVGRDVVLADIAGWLRPRLAVA